MSVVERTLDGRNYIHIRRKVHKTQEQLFWRTDGLSDEEISKLLVKAHKQDKVWEDLQNRGHYLSELFNNGIPAHMRISYPRQNHSWTMRAHREKTKNTKKLDVSRSLDRHGFDAAFDDVFNAIINNARYKPEPLILPAIKNMFYQHAKVLLAKAETNWKNA